MECLPELKECKTFCNDAQIYPAMKELVEEKEYNPTKAGKIIEEMTEGAVTWTRARKIYLDRTKNCTNVQKQENTNNNKELNGTKSSFNLVNENIDWAKWSWNPVTGCLHGCEYCYARDIANRFYANKFEPTFHEYRLKAPNCTTIPHNLDQDPGRNKVFVCSMADLFGNWVNPEWINKILTVCTETPKWTYIFLTKNPKRYLEFKMPDNSWIGATGDTQARVDEALKVFGQSNHPIKFISAEPLLENIKIGPEINWLIIGGQSKSSNCPAFQPPLRWIGNLLQQADRYNIDIYLKPNLQIVKKYPNEI